MKKEEEGKSASNETDNLLNGIFGEKPVAATQTGVEKEGLRGKVKQITQQHFKAFERDGNVYLNGQEGEYYEDKNVVLTFDEAGRKIEKICSSDNGMLFGTFYNEKGQIKELKHYSSLGVVSSKISYLFNADDDVVESIEYNNSKDIYSKSIYTYISKGKEFVVDTFDKDGALTQHRETTYDKNELKIELQMTNAKGELTHWSKDKRNLKGHIVETQYLKPDGSIDSITSLYQYYDAAGDPIEDKAAKKKEDNYTSRVEKDKHGNWIKKMLCYRKQAAFVYLRDIEYFDEPFAPKETVGNDYFKLPLLVENISMQPISDEESIMMSTDEWPSEMTLDSEDAKFVTERSPDHENFSFLSYYTVKNNDFPSVITHKEGNIETRALLKELEMSLDGQIVNSVKNIDSRGHSLIERYTVIFPENPGYMVHASDISRVDADGYEEPPFLDELGKYDFDKTLHLSDIIILLPSDASGINEQNRIIDTINRCIENSTVEVKEEIPHIYMVQVTSNNAFMLQSHLVKDDFEIDDLDIQYGYGFEKFHDELMDRFNNENQGLVLFHGMPGTGKTYYIRHLLREMALGNKIVIYMPPNMVDYLVDPGFMTFLSQTVTTFSATGRFCVLLIEDAEPLLASRNTGGRIQGVTNLLNMTDGLLNDMLKLQIICTFNVDLKELDAALLRPGRLIARKEFKPLGEIEANLLAQSLGIKHHFTVPATLSEIYAQLKNKNTLIHDDY